MLKTIAAVMLLVTTSVFGADAPKIDIYSVVDNNACHDWKKYSPNSNAVKAHYYWFLGFVSGNNFALPGSQVAPKRMLSESGFVSLVNSRCKASPKYTITIIAMEFVENNSPPADVKTNSK